MQIVRRLVAVAVVALAGLVWVGPAVAEARYPTPEDAVTAYLEGVKARDFSAISATTAADEMAKGFDFVGLVDWLRAADKQTPAPATDPLFVAIHEANLMAAIARQVQFLAYGLMTTEGLIEGKMVSMDGEGAAAFAATVDAIRLGGITIEKIGVPKPALLNKEANLRNLAHNAALYGADEATERVVLISFEGKSFMVGFYLMRYGEEWTIRFQNSFVAGTDVLGVPMPITPEAFEDVLK